MLFPNIIIIAAVMNNMGQQTQRLSSTLSSLPRIRLVWHRRDLRLHDNSLYSDLIINGNEKNRKNSNDYQDDDNQNDPGLSASASTPTVQVASIYIFDDIDFQRRPSTCLPNEWDAINIGPHATRILLDSVTDLRQSLQRIGGDLWIRKGSPAKILPEMIRSIGATEVYWNEEPGVYEQQTSKNVRQSIQCQFPGIKIINSMEYTLYHPDDLPYGQDEWEQLLSNNNKNKKKRRKGGNKNNDTNRKSTQIPGQVDVSTQRWTGMPKIMGDFRKAARIKTRPRPCLPTPTQLHVPDAAKVVDIGNIPKLEDLLSYILEPTTSENSGKKRTILGLSDSVIQNVIYHAIELNNQQYRQSNAAASIHATTSTGDGNSNSNSNDDNHLNDNIGNTNITTIPRRGGETVALQHLSEFCTHHAATAVRNLASVEENQSSQISHFLAFGCLSPRKVIEIAEAQTNDNDNDCSWMISHMTMRDFFLYTCICSGNQFYKLEGIPVSKKGSESIVWNNLNDGTERKKWERWAMGETKLPLIDAAIIELLQTGYCSNRVRQNAASVLTKDLCLDWRAGAEWFQFLLDDHCVGANWGNWLYFSGVGPDPKQRHFRTISQALRYDNDGKYVRKWLPKLATINGTESFLRPWDFSKDWGMPIVNPQTQYTWHDFKALQEQGSLVATTNKD